ncbi:hypothetical protein CA51_27200 [Rosistilla oblonga]|uniref:hypothetical protein n=1 Tax=Rosistilla oblonga TaxID=2527990 RepID=UPI00118BF435|nr:hypothetical protein [Rosistilla oblonga]QDV12834.1 hypothetical protein CA51_27200 [Rosistilla oblonga]
MPSLRLILTGFAITLVVGCTEMVTEGDAKVFQTSSVGATIRTVFGLVLVVLAGVAVAGSLLPDRKPKNRQATAKEKLTSGQRMGLALFGFAIGMVGLFLAAISLIFPHKLHVSVYPDRVEMASTFSQTGGNEVVIPFSNVASVEIRDEINTVGKSKKHLVFSMKGGGEIKAAAGNNELQSLQTIQETLATYKSQAPAVPRRRPARGPVDVKARLQPAPQTPKTEETADTKPAASSAPASTYTLKRYPIKIPIPSDQSPVLPDTVVNVGEKLNACYAGRWHKVTVVAVNSDGTITCNWDSWPTYTYHMLREDLTLEKSNAQ